MLQNICFLAKIGLDTAENDHPKSLEEIGNFRRPRWCYHHFGLARSVRLGERFEGATCKSSSTNEHPFELRASREVRIEAGMHMRLGYKFTGT